ncbi:MAG: CHRD domain-containing protein, partial [Acidimicrobiia bacterium]|nr:CHRD domain-containing protein [Acidimicrobiia bacterium]
MSVSLAKKAGAAGAVTIAVLVGGGSATAADEEVPEPASFTSAFTAAATPDEIINPDGMAVAGEEGATGTFNFRINSDEEIICYDIMLNGVTPPYMSMARSATHIHEALAGQSGPPRVTFRDPEDAGDGTLRSSGCIQGPFTTGIEAEGGGDTGDGFSLKSIEADPAGHYGDTHTMDFVAGAVRGQLSQVPLGGVPTGGGGTA